MCDYEQHNQEILVPLSGHISHPFNPPRTYPTFPQHISQPQSPELLPGLVDLSADTHVALARLLDYFSEHTAPSIALIDQTLTFWSIEIPTQAQLKLFLAHIISALAALHVAREQSQNVTH